jgi:alanine-glyoxylate transaminase / serine-glyoxylate transaminase / serine-pyruvate transaminase
LTRPRPFSRILNELELLGGLAGVEMALRDFGVPVRLGAGVAAAQEFLLGAS